MSAVHCDDMLTETAYVKLGWLLGQNFDREQVKRMMLENIAGEITPRRINEENEE